MASMNDQIRAAVGTVGTSVAQGGDVSQGNRVPANSVSLKNIATNGSLLNQKVGSLIKALDTLKGSWGG